MNLNKSQAIDPDLVFLDTVDSTNLELARMLKAGAHRDLLSIVAAEQSAGKGRMDRSWVSEHGSSIALSVLLVPTREIEVGLVPLFVGSCVAIALRELVQTQTGVKWPNDVLIAGSKVCGVLSELTDAGVVAGIGINLRTQIGAPDTACAVNDFVVASFDDVLSAVLAEIHASWRLWLQHGNEFALGLIRANSLTIGQQVRAILPDGKELVGTAEAISDDGRLQIVGSETQLLSAADVWHLRN